MIASNTCGISLFSDDMLASICTLKSKILSVIDMIDIFNFYPSISYKTNRTNGTMFRNLNGTFFETNIYSLNTRIRGYVLNIYKSINITFGKFRPMSVKVFNCLHIFMFNRLHNFFFFFFFNCLTCALTFKCFILY